MTLEEVARRARVSTSTVSRVLNNRQVVKESTRKRVLEVIQKLNYSPNIHARSLAGGKTTTLGMLVSSVRNPFFIDVFSGLESAAREKGYEVILEHTEYNVRRLLAGVRLMVSRRIAGLAVVVSEMEPSVIQEIQASNLPVAYYDVGAPSPKATNFRVRYEVGMERMVRYLYSLGHRRMGFVGHHTNLSPLQVRKKVFLKTLEQYGGEVECRTALAADGPAGGAHAVRELLATGFRPTAIVCVNDFMAIGVLRELRAQGFSIPGDISVSGFDNVELSEYTHPLLTTINIPRREIGKMAVDALLARQEGPNQYSEVVIEPELVLRDSVGPPPAR